MSGRFHTRYGPWAVVTGAAQGLGAAVTVALLRRGVHVLGLDLPEQSPERRVAALAAGAGAEALAVGASLDLADPDFVPTLDVALRDAVAARCGRSAGVGEPLGCVVACAADSPLGAFVDTAEARLVRAVRVNAEGTVRLARWAAPRLVARGHGGLVLVGSVAGLVGSTHVAAYAATKAFDLVLADGLALELEPLGVDVLGVALGAVDTPGLRASAPARTLAASAPDAVAEGMLDALGRTRRWASGPGARAADVLTGGGPVRRLLQRAMARTMARLYGPLGR